MLVNLFDFNFRQSVCSTAFQTPTHIQYVRDLADFDGVTLFTDGYINDGSVERVRSRHKIAWLHEPYCLHPDIYAGALGNAHKFDLILTYYQPYLDMAADYGHALYGKFRFCPYGGTWIDRAQWSIKPKSKLCSMLVGDKRSTSGHQIRQEVANLIERKGYPVDLYGSKGYPVGYGQETKMRVLADYAFTIVTETCAEDNLFTEWLLDCFALGTIPIFWGCPNLEQYFDWHGVWWFRNLAEAERHLQTLNMNHYAGRMQAVYKNLLYMQPYAITEDWLYLNILKEFDR